MTKKQIWRQTTSVLLWAGVSLFWYLMFAIVWPYTSGKTNIDFLLTKQRIVHLDHYMWAFYLHIFSSLWILAAGLTQFSSTILRRKPALHRWIGRIYVAIILFVSAPAALVMSYYANGGWWSKASFAVLSVCWWWTTWRGYQAIRDKKIAAHRSWLIRSYALTLSAITLRVMQFGFATFTQLDPEFTYRLIAWPSWLLNLLLAEIIIRRKTYMG